MYRLDRVRRDYKKFTKAERYCLCYDYKGIVYATFVNEIPRKFLSIEKECSRNGRVNDYGLYVNLRKKKNKEYLLKKDNTIILGTYEDINGKEYNRGVMCEKLVYEHFGQEFKGKDNIPFFKSGDITIDGVEVQVKYGRARVCTNSTLTRLKKSA